MHTGSKLILLTLLMWLPTSRAAAEVCRNSRTLATLVSESDAVAVIEEVRPRRDRLRTILDSVARNPVQYFKFNEILKPSLQQDTTGVHVLYTSKRRPVVSASSFSSALPPRYVAFLSGVRLREWTPLPCAQLTLTNSNLALDACGGISDLLGDQRWERERCLIENPPGATLDQIKAELKRVFLDKKDFFGTVRFASNLNWQPGALYQVVYLEMDTKTRKELLQTKTVRETSPIKVYLPSNVFSERELSNRATRGARVTVQGSWQQGNFIIHKIDWGFGRRPRSF